MNARGIDVSYWQGTLKWNKLKEQGVDFAFARTNYGATNVDGAFKENWPKMHDAGLLCGAYFFYVFDESPEKQAELLLKTVAKAGGGAHMPYVVDVEHSRQDYSHANEVSIGKRISGLQACLDVLEKEMGRPPIIYTAASTWKELINEASFAKYPLWIAHYTLAKQPTLPKGWDNWHFWQYRSPNDGLTRYGAETVKYDTDQFNGSLAALQQWVSGDTTRSLKPQPTRTTKMTKTTTHPDQLDSYTVQAGDNLYTIAHRFGTTTAVLVQLNSISNPDDIDVGQVLKLPTPAIHSQTYTVQPGDSLYKIAHDFGTTIDALVRLNNIADPDKLEVGDVLKLS